MADLTGRVALVTGASSGIGAVTARMLAAQGAEVIPVGRSPERTADTAARIGVEPEVADFADLTQVRELAGRIRGRTDRLDLVVHNAGALVPRRTTTVDGHELTFQANHLAPFLLQSLVSDLMTGPDPRVIVTSSAAHNAGHLDLDDLDGTRGRYVGFLRYAASKLANLMFAAELARRSPVTAVSVHPGLVASNFANDSVLFAPIYRTALRNTVLITSEQGAAPLLRLATRPDLTRFDGRYFSRFRPGRVLHPQARSTATAIALWEASEVLLQT